MKKRDIADIKRTLHYLKVLYEYRTPFQHEIRDAIKYAIEVLTDYLEAIR